uniref:Uncharacterized protein n=1 Tax=Anopheles atroparvus TaxID=41427 RepID=A0AAG5CUG7_ANOAO
MDRNEKLSLADFNRKLRKYCTSAVACAAKEKECVSRLETIIAQRDACIAHLAKERERDMLLSEEIEDLQHQREDALEFFQMVEKRYQKYAAELSLNAGRSIEKEAASDKMDDNVDDESPAEQAFRRILRKYCNLYVQFNKRSNIVRVLSLEDNSYFEIDLSESVSTEMMANTWSKVGSSSVHLSSWEKLL